MPTAPHKAVPLAVPSALDVESMVESSAVLNLVQGENAIVKTVKNGDWLGLVWQLAQGQPFRTSLTLPPANGRGMQLFGRSSSGCAGLIWSASELDLEDPTGVFCWPSGYFAKTEHNLAK